jgi:hypothetical protein
MGGLNENDPAAVNQMLAFCNRLLAEWPGCSVLIPSHTGKDAAKGVRGSNAFEAAADTVIELERLEGREVLVKVEKQRCGEENREGWSLKGEKTGESLTFSLCKAQPRGLTGLETSFQAVEKVLRDKGIDTDSAGVTTHVLAEMIWTYKEGGDMSEALWKGFLKDKEKELNKAAKAQLKPLFHGDHKWAAPKQSL